MAKKKRKNKLKIRSQQNRRNGELQYGNFYGRVLYTGMYRRFHLLFIHQRGNATLTFLVKYRIVSLKKSCKIAIQKRKVPLHLVWEEWAKWIEPLHGLYIPLVLPCIYCDIVHSLFLLCISFEKKFCACLDLHANNFSRQRLRKLSS